MLKTQVIGNLGKDAVVREINGNIALNFSIAHNERIITGDGEVIDRTLWVNCTRWLKKRGELHKYLTKGTLIHVSGVPSVKMFTNKEGRPDVDFRLKVDSIELLSKGKSQEEAAPVEKTEAQKEQEVKDAFVG